MFQKNVFWYKFWSKIRHKRSGTWQHILTCQLKSSWQIKGPEIHLHLDRIDDWQFKKHCTISTSKVCSKVPIRSVPVTVSSGQKNRHFVAPCLKDLYSEQLKKTTILGVTKDVTRKKLIALKMANNSQQDVETVSKISFFYLSIMRTWDT